MIDTPIFFFMVVWLPKQHAAVDLEQRMTLAYRVSTTKGTA